MPVFNAEAFLAEALESVFSQDYSPFEVIVVDDGSEDRSAEIALSFPDVRYFRQENQGPGVARNWAVRLAEGDLIAYVDADDMIPPWKLRVQAGFLDEHPEITCVMGRQEWIDPPAWLARDPVYDELDGIPILSMVIRKQAMVELDGFDDDRGGDLDLLVRMRERGQKYAVLPELVLYRRYHGGNLVAGKSLSPLPLISLKAKLDRERARREAV